MMGTLPSQFLMFFVCALLTDLNMSVPNLPNGVKEHTPRELFTYYEEPRLSVIYPDEVERYFHADEVNQLTSRELFDLLLRRENSTIILPDVIRLHVPRRRDDFVHLTRDGVNDVQTLYTDFMRDLPSYMNFDHNAYIQRIDSGRNLGRRTVLRHPPLSFLEFGELFRGNKDLYPRDEAFYLNGQSKNVVHVWGEPVKTPKYWSLFRKRNNHGQHEMPNQLYCKPDHNRKLYVFVPPHKLNISPREYSKLYREENARYRKHSGSASSSRNTSSI